MAAGLTSAPSGALVAPGGLSMVRVQTTVVVVASTNYVAEDVLSDSASVGTAWTFADVASVNGASGTIIKAICLCQTTDLTHGVTLLLYDTTPTSNLNDNAANTGVAHADAAKYIGKIEFPALGDIGTSTGDPDAQVVPGSGGLPLPFVCAGADNDIYGILVTRDAITGEIAGHEYIIILQVAQD